MLVSVLKKGVKLRTKMNVLVVMTILFALLLVIAPVTWLFIHVKFAETGNQALMLARSVSELPEVKAELASARPDPNGSLQTVIEKIRKKSGAEFIVITDMQLIRYTHTNPAKIGNPLSDDDEDLNREVLQGHEITTTSTGSLGYSVRSKTPVYDEAGRQIGLVSVGFLVETIWSDIYDFLIWFAIIGLFAFLFGIGGSYLLSGHIKKQILNMEPEEIAFLANEQAAILNSTREGILAVNRDGIVITCNKEALKMLELACENPRGMHVREVLGATRLPEIVADGIVHRDEPMIVGQTMIVMNCLPLSMNGKTIGAVATFRDKLELSRIDERLLDIGQYIDSIRSQRHEFLNKLHLLSGLIQLKQYEMVHELIEEINEDQQELLDFFLAKVHDPAIVGVLIGKIHRGRELGIALHVEAKTAIPEVEDARELILTFLGNTIENAFESIGQETDRTEMGQIEVYMQASDGQLMITVHDNGSGVPHELQNNIFRDGVTTKGTGRGFGLALVERLARLGGGQLELLDTAHGASFRLTLPLGGGET
ncbi:UNVERIFIED_CONTAM: two-component system CitB family sensor kinase [Brevibacillus sp. OAP136]